MNELGARRLFPDQSSGSGQTLATSRQPVVDPTPSKWVCFYKSGDPQFNGLRMVINNRTFKTFDALLDSLSKKVPLPFGVRNITTPRGVHGIRALDELEDGKSYICSDTRKVKPINLALARKKLPPWYHARPISARRRVVQLARFYPGRAKHKQEPVVVRTPKRLMIFRNGDPSIRHTVMLQKRTTPTFESLLDHISELMQFHVVKLYIPDGRRVEGLPALILCPGAVVASGREPFKPGNYNVQKSPPPIWLPTNRIQNSITESLCDFPSNPTDSVELETGHVLESVAETEEDPCPGHGTQHGCLPTEDDIEKSFRVNQDGSMTVEMKVRLTIKEEETVHWTTTLTRSSVANQLNASCLPEPEPLPQLDQDNNSPEYNPRERQHPATSVDTSNSNKWKDDDDNDPPSLDNGVVGDDEREEDCVKVQTNAVSPRRAPTPGPRRFRMEQASEDSIESVTAEEIREGTARSYSYREQTENGAVTEQYCVVKQRSVRPVPKPRRYSSVDVNNRNSGGQSAFQSAGMAEILQIKDSGEEVSESFLHISVMNEYVENWLEQARPHPTLYPGDETQKVEEGMTNLNREELNANNVSCAEALKMIDSLREIASIEDSDTLKTSLSDLQKSASKQLLQSWKGFQELSDKCKSRSPTPNYSDQELMFEASCVEACGTEENVIDELMNELDVPEMLKEELAALPKSRRTASDDEGKMGANIIGKVELSPEEKVNQTLVRTDQATKGRKCEFEEEEDKQPSTNSCAIFNISSGESIASPDVIDQTGSEEDQTEAEWKELNAIIEENLSGSEGDLDTTKEEQGYGIDVQPGSKEGREEDKVRPGVPVDQGRWLLTENTVIRKSASDPSGISKTVDKSPQDEDKREEKCEETQENIPYSLFSTKSEVEDKSLSTKCTYFSLPHASDSDACQDDLSTVSTSAACDSTAERIEASKETKMQAERNGILPAFIATDLKMPDNKVHPLIEGPPDCEVVVVQPTKGHSVVRRRPQEPDLLEVLYTFCGQHCPIL
ncbi:uncharacterized protein ACJ7VT_016210 [Polymixia lowei]